MMKMFRSNCVYFKNNFVMNVVLAVVVVVAVAAVVYVIFIVSEFNLRTQHIEVRY